MVFNPWAKEWDRACKKLDTKISHYPMEQLNAGAAIAERIKTCLNLRYLEWELENKYKASKDTGLKQREAYYRRWLKAIGEFFDEVIFFRLEMDENEEVVAAKNDVPVTSQPLPMNEKVAIKSKGARYVGEHIERFFGRMRGV